MKNGEVDVTERIISSKIKLLRELCIIRDTEIHDYQKIYMDYISKCRCSKKSDLIHAAENITRKIIEKKL